jgi:hypothetical protein
MRTLDDVFDSWTTLTEMATDVGVNRPTVEKWREREWIPHKHWPALLGALRRKGKDLSADGLLAMHFPKRRRSSSERIRA